MPRLSTALRHSRGILIVAALPILASTLMPRLFAQQAICEGVKVDCNLWGPGPNNPYPGYCCTGGGVPAYQICSEGAFATYIDTNDQCGNLFEITVVNGEEECSIDKMQGCGGDVPNSACNVFQC